MRHVTLTSGWLTTNGSNFKRGKLHYSPWHSDICSSNQLNTPPGQLPRPFETRNCTHKSGGANQTLWISFNQMGTTHILSDGIREVISNFNSDTIPATIFVLTNTRTKAIPNSNAVSIFKSNPNQTHRSTPLRAGGLLPWLCEAVGGHLSSQYVTQVDLSFSGHLFSMTVLGRNVCNCSSAINSVLDARTQWQWIGEHMRDGWYAERVQEMRDLCESIAANSQSIVFSIGRGLGSRLLFSRSPVDGSFKRDDQSTCQFIVIRASSLVRVNIPSKCVFYFSFECSS